MNWFKRISNIWKLGKYYESINPTFRATPMSLAGQKDIFEDKKAQIIKRHNDPAGEIVGDKKIK